MKEKVVIIFYYAEFTRQSVVPVGCFVVEPPVPAVISEKRDLGEEYKNHVEKFAAMLSNPLYGLEESGRWLRDWIRNTLPVEPLLPVSASFGFSSEGFEHVSTLACLHRVAGWRQSS